ncbi:SSS family solute:Na+ symporter [Exophiala viscosa]|uniref:SSS family solute:Na+ symporter n=1 Tax=Exophiala viscosa TaxID=2486360 RepID=A0AAN6ICH0_9EURO|nr:SSS family solute:Na+ symporter [Exophiala viscosa]
MSSPQDKGFGYSIILGLGFAFALGMVGTTWALKRYYREVSFLTAGRIVKSGIAYFYGILLFATIAIDDALLIPITYTFLEVIKARYSVITYIVFLVFSLMTNILRRSELAIRILTVVACFLLPIGVVLYTMFSGIKATFLTDYIYTVIILVIIFVFAFSELLVNAAKRHPVLGDHEGSYLTIRSKERAVFFVINTVGNFGTIFLDNDRLISLLIRMPGYYNKAIAISPVDTLLGYLYTTTIGLATLALENNPVFPTYPNRILYVNISAKLILLYAAVALLSKGGAGATLLLIFIAITSASSTELIAISGKFLIRIFYVSYIVYALILASFSTGLFYAGVSIGYLYLIISYIISKRSKLVSRGAPVLGLLVTTKKQCGAFTIDYTGSNNPMLAGNVTTLLSPLVFIPVSIKAIRRGDDSEIIRRTSVSIESDIPMPIYKSGYIFSKKFFTKLLVVIGISWLFFSTACMGLFPLWQGRKTMAHTVKSMFLDLTGKYPAIHGRVSVSPADDEGVAGTPDEKTAVKS